MYLLQFGIHFVARRLQVVARADTHQHAPSVGQQLSVRNARTHMEDKSVKLLCTLDSKPFLVVSRVAFRRQHHAHRSLLMPLHIRRLQGLARSNRMKQRVGIGCQQREHHLCLGVAETSIELNHFNTLRRLHQSAIEHAR